ncbi:GGDEF and EAL domain-containing protein [Gottschalkia acidurici]|uniref:GGDEF and EAL domain-containing protein n=1 Tax=Clostridium acidurici TaxID=1556 RepID=UPI00031E4C7A|nr:GGDEF and EAL domain-containing protein [Gottschalkia acidurici]
MDSKSEQKSVLIINSHNENYSWTERVLNGILEKLNSSKLDVDISVESLEQHGLSDKDDIDNMYKLIMNRYSDKKTDLVITTDLMATEFAIKYRENLFRDTPIVFSGISKEKAREITKGVQNIAGCIEKLNIEETLTTAFKATPNAKELYVIHDKTNRGISIFKYIKSTSLRINKDIDVKSFSEMGEIKLNTSLPKIPKDSLLIGTVYLKDDDGRETSIPEISSRISNEIKLPMYHLHEMAIGHGIVGGSLSSGNLHGKNTGELALRILNGEKISDVGIVEKDNSINMYDYNILKKYNIDKRFLPKNSLIINKPSSFYEDHKNIVLGFITAIIILSCTIIFLGLNIKKRKKVEVDLKLANDELFAVYEELASSDEELKLQYHELKKSRETIEKNEERYRLVSEASNDGFWDMDTVTKNIFTNVRLKEVLGLDESEVRNYIDRLDKYVHPDDFNIIENIFKEIKQGVRDSYHVEYRTLDKYGTYRWILAKGKSLRDKDGNMCRISGFHIDIEDRKLQEEQIKVLAYYDSITGLPNRAMFYKKMDNILKQEDSCGSVIYMDIDNFKIINDTFGHEFGDLLLKKLADRLKPIESKESHVFRLSGDEYIIVFEKYNEDNIEQKIIQTQEYISEPFSIDDNEIQISVSMGVVFYPKDGRSVEEVLKKADLAMYKAKEFGKNCYKTYEKNMEEEIENRLLLENHLRNALDRDEFVLNYQPQIDTVSKKVVGFEALIRWVSPEYGTISPIKFISIAEETGLINQMGEWILREACKFAMNIESIYDEQIVVSVNISSIQLSQDNFIEIIKRVIDDTGMNPKFLGIEITETSLMELFEENSEKLEILRNMGITVYLDDFGTGYSSLNYLLRLPISTIKIDRTFVMDMMNAKKGVKITESIINLAHNMGLNVTAEGVENEEQLSILRDLSCDVIQGYIFGKPLSESDAIQYLEDRIKD